ncbi:MAG: xanthine dehydrogenase accessory protein XdhC [Alphaproteobacteria bacterium]|nr:xanthine dehydrogenase accessory protein XdhC [Alphaproteobacteria bacterium]
MSDWLTALSELRQAGKPAVLVTVIATEGSAPREAGTKMVVAADSQYGTIGGGHLEFRAAGIARDMLRACSAAPRSEAFALGPKLGQCCGGSATLLFEPIAASGFEVAIFGAGHVAQALVRTLAPLPCRIAWYDSRAELFPRELPANVTVDAGDDLSIGIRRAPAEAYLLIMTHSHALDQDLVEAALRKDDFGYLGLIGSATKRARFVARLTAKGLDCSRLTCPIGLPGVGTKHPGEIAIAVAAQILAMRTAAQTRHADKANEA